MKAETLQKGVELQDELDNLKMKLEALSEWADLMEQGSTNPPQVDLYLPTSKRYQYRVSLPKEESVFLIRMEHAKTAKKILELTEELAALSD